jgi:hypothetical protein
MDRAGAAEAFGQRLPLAARAQHINNGGENVARRNRFSTAARPTPILAPLLLAWVALRQQRFDA